MTVAGVKFGSFEKRETGAQIHRVNVADVIGTFAAYIDATREIVNAAKGVEMQLGVAGVDREPGFREPGAIRAILASVGSETGDTQ